MADDARARRLELVATLILTLSSILTAWVAFQAAKWGGRQSVAFADAAATRTNASRLATRADQVLAFDASLFIAWTQAVAADIGPEELRAHGYRPKPGSLSHFLRARFPDHLAKAVDAWLATNPFQNTGAPASPFEMTAYLREDAERAKLEEAKADLLADDARQDNLRSDRYVAVNVVLAIALFSAGIATKLEGPFARTAMVGVAAVVLLGVCAVLATYPVALG